MKRATPLTPELYDYLLAVSLREHEVQRRLRTTTEQMPNGGMQIAPDQAPFMQFLVKMLGATRTLEIGVFTGYSALTIALALPEDGVVIACDVSHEWTQIGRRFWREAGVDHKIDLRLGPGVETLQSLLDNGNAGSFDFAFIDADKSNYDHYYELCLKLVRHGGVIALDNTLWHGDIIDVSLQDADTLAMRAINAKVHADERVDSVLVPIGDGMMLARKR
jgi:caffeoyl-CoA O-methyltransferase